MIAPHSVERRFDLTEAPPSTGVGMGYRELQLVLTGSREHGWCARLVRYLHPPTMANPWGHAISVCAETVGPDESAADVLLGLAEKLTARRSAAATRGALWRQRSKHLLDLDLDSTTIAIRQAAAWAAQEFPH